MCLKKECMRHATMMKWKGEEEETNSHQNTVDASSIIFFPDILLGQEGKKVLSDTRLWKNRIPSMNINSLSGIDGHYVPLKRPSSALWWFRSNLVVLHGQKNGPYGALPKIKEEDSVTSAAELQRSTFNLHIFLLCCKISATTVTLPEWIKISSIFGEEKHHYTPCLVATFCSFGDTKEDSGKYSSFRGGDNRKGISFLACLRVFLFSFKIFKRLPTRMW